MTPGRKISLYVSEAVADNLRVLAERYPHQSTNEIVRFAVARAASDAECELAERDARQIEADAYGRGARARKGVVATRAPPGSDARICRMALPRRGGARWPSLELS